MTDSHSTILDDEEPVAASFHVSMADGERAVVSVVGEVDVATCQPLGDLLDDLIAGGVVDILLDGRAMTFLDCAGLGALATRACSVRRRGGRLVLVSARRPVRRLIELGDLSGLIVPLPDTGEPMAERGRPLRPDVVSIR